MLAAITRSSSRVLPRRAASLLHLRGGATLDALQPRRGVDCMETAGLLPIQLVDHTLPAALQTHEMLFLPDQPQDPSGAAGGTGVGVVLISQMEEGRLLRCDVGPDGVLKAQFDTATFEPPSAADGSGLPFVGLHGLACASAPGKAWVTLQYLNQVCLIDVKTMKVEVSIKCPRALADGRGPIGGPHCARECHGHLYVCMKGGASICHASGEEAGMAQEAGAHALWRVKLDGQLEPVDDGIVFEAPPTPVMCDVTPDGDCWVACDASPTLFRVPAGAKTGDDCVYHQLPFHYAQLRQTGPGIVVGPDGRPWFCILNGNGIIGRVSPEGELQMFELHQTFNRHQRLCHLSWDSHGVLYAISSDLVDKKALNTLIRLKFDATFTHVIAQHEIAFPSQHTCVHRIMHLDAAERPSVLVSELSTSQVLQCFKDGLPPLDHHPMKTMEVTARRVYDAKAPCPRSGNPLCHCSEATGATMPTENVWADPSADAIFDPTETPSIRELERITDPRTGEEQLLHDMSRGTKADSAFSRFWSYGVKGFEASDAPLPNMYAYNGATERGSTPEGGRLGASTDVLRYKPEYLRKMLAREPWRRAQLVTELKAAGIDVDEVEEKEDCCKE